RLRRPRAARSLAARRGAAHRAQPSPGPEGPRDARRRRPRRARQPRARYPAQGGTGRAGRGAAVGAGGAEPARAQPAPAALHRRPHDHGDRGAAAHASDDDPAPAQRMPGGAGRPRPRRPARAPPRLGVAAREHHPRRGLDAAMSCPDAESLLLFAEGRLDERALARMESHLDTCADCRELAAHAVRERRAAEPGGPAPSGAPGPPLARGTCLGRYVVIEQLGAGGMGVVYAAFDPELDRRVAIKLIRPEVSARADARTRLVREAQAMARLAHPNV